MEVYLHFPIRFHGVVLKFQGQIYLCLTLIYISLHVTVLCELTRQYGAWLQLLLLVYYRHP